MRAFGDIVALAAGFHGGEEALETLLTGPLPRDEIRAAPNDRWLATATKCIFQAGFSWQVIDRKWPRFEEVFEGFDVHRCSMMSDDDVARLTKAEGIVANGAKIKSVGDNARFLRGLAETHGSVGAHFAGREIPAYTTNLQALRDGGSRLGGRTGQMFLRRMGVDTLVFSPDV